MASNCRSRVYRGIMGADFICDIRDKLPNSYLNKQEKDHEKLST